MDSTQKKLSISSSVSMTPSTHDESLQAKKMELFGLNHHQHKNGKIPNHHKTAEELEEEVQKRLPVSKFGWKPLEDVETVYLEWGTKDGVGLTLGEYENVFDIVDNSHSKNERLFVGIEILDEFSRPIKQNCCRNAKQKGHNFDLTILGCDGGEVMNLSKTTPAEVILTCGKEHVGLIKQEDGLGKNEVPFRYTIHDENGPLLVVRRSQIDPETDWGIITYEGDPKPTHIGKVSNLWYGLKGGMSNINTNGFAVEFGKDVKPKVKGFLVAMLFTLIFIYLQHTLRIRRAVQCFSGSRKSRFQV